MANRKPLTIFGLALLLSGSAFAGIKGDSAPDYRLPTFVEANPLNEAPTERLPKYIRINVAGYNVREDVDFDVNKRHNVDHKTTKGALYAVTRIQKMQRGLAVGVYDGDKERWIYVPNWRKSDFQFCESEACFADLAAVLKILGDQKISPSNLSECGITLGEHGEVLDASLPVRVEPATLPKARPAAAVAKLDRVARPVREAAAAPAVRPAPIAKPAIAAKPAAPAPAPARAAARTQQNIWERSLGAKGSLYSKQLSESLDRYGQGLLKQRTLGDAAEWCPKYSRLTDPQRKEFWMHVIPAMTRFESEFRPTATYDEASKSNPRRGRVNPRTYSQGISQLSYATAAMRPYREFCKFDWSRDKNKMVNDPSLTIYDTQKQFDCTVGIMNKWISKDHRIGGSSGSGAARFWSTFRYSNPKTQKVKSLARQYKPCFGR